MSIEHPQQEQAARYASLLRERFATQGMLAELQEYPNFVVWRYSMVDGQRKKLPFNPNIYKLASPKDANTWGSLASALDALATGQFQGIGFMLSQSPFSGIDLDHFLEGGILQPWAQEPLAELSLLYFFGAIVKNSHDPEAAGIDISLIAYISPIEWTNVILYGEYKLNRDLVR